MATAPRQASLSSDPSNYDNSRLPATEPPTVEESPGELDLISILREAAVTGSRPLESIVDAVADAARVLSDAEGTALGLETRGVILCRARSGSIAPPIGAAISTESGISGECLRTANILVCHDAMADPRVDAAVCRSLGIRSIAAVPVRGSVRVAGILEAFSERPNAFNTDALISLRDLAEIAGTAYLREAQSYAPTVKPAPPMTRPTAYSPPYPAQPLAAEDVLDDEVSDPGKRRILFVGLVALFLLLAVGVAWWAWHTPGDETSSSGNPQSVRAASPDPSHTAPALAFVPKPAPGMSNRSEHPERSDRSRTPVVQNAAELKPIDLRAEESNGGSGTADTVEVRAPKTASEEAAVPEPPTVDLAPPANSDALARLGSVPTQMPVAAPRISQGVVEAALIHRVEPIYPVTARNERLQGKVTLLATIATNGSVRQVAVQSGSPILAEAAKFAVLKWRYRPATLNGTPIEVQKEIIVLFAQP